MQTITMSSNDFMLNYPESVSIKRNPNGTYNFYSLMRTKYIQNMKDVSSLMSVKSENLRWEKDLSLSIEMSSESRITYGMGANDVKLCSFKDLMSRQILYNLKFSKTEDMLVEFEILNKGEGLMNYNVYEGLENYTVQVNVAGFTKEELDVILEDGLIRVRTKPISKLEITDDDCLSKNFEKTKSECEIYLPNVESVEAELKDGILYLSIPKISKGEKIDIKIA